MLMWRGPLLGQNRHDQQYGNLAQHQVPINASHMYPESPGPRYQQQRYSQGMFYDALSKPPT